MQPTQVQDSTTLLTYSLTTTPMPVQVSPSTTTASDANLTFVVSCPRSVGTAKVAQIEIVIPVDTSGKPPDPTNLAETAPPLSSASISSSGTDQWNVVAGISPGVFIFTPKGGPVQVSAQSLTIELNGIQVNTVVGTALVRINEWAAPGTTTPPPVTSPPSGVGTFAVAKFPYGFFAGNFTADQPMIQNGQRPTLSWQGSTNATYQILYEGQTVDVSRIQTWSPTSIPPSPVLTHTTTFILQVSAQVDGQTATIDFNITIEVAKPSLIANDLTVLTSSNLQGAVTVGQTSAPANLTLYGNLNSTGSLNCSSIGSNNGTCWFFNNNPVLSTFRGTNASASVPTIYTINSVKGGYYVTGIFAQVAADKDWGLVTNGLVGGSGGNLMFTHLPTKRGHRVVTSPMCLEAEVHVSGTQKLSKGKARVKFERDVADMIVHSSKETYRVLLTPIGQSNGLTVTDKSKTGFAVTEMAGGKSNAGFDWFIIAHKPATRGATARQKMPAKLPRVKAAKPPAQRKKR